MGFFSRWEVLESQARDDYFCVSPNMILDYFIFFRVSLLSPGMISLARGRVPGSHDRKKVPERGACFKDVLCLKIYGHNPLSDYL